MWRVYSSTDLELALEGGGCRVRHRATRIPCRVPQLSPRRARHGDGAMRSLPVPRGTPGASQPGVIGPQLRTGDCRPLAYTLLVVGTGVDPVTSRFSGARSTN